jgi:hypothetical protein
MQGCHPILIIFINLGLAHDKLFNDLNLRVRASNHQWSTLLIVHCIDVNSLASQNKLDSLQVTKHNSPMQRSVTAL